MRELYEVLDLNSPDMLAGHRPSPAARAGPLSLREGYRPVPNFNGNPVATFFGEKRLSG
ncbi:hypothetical protein ABGB19_19485 [Mycobacterium sp. B14F4]|uniref:hypothetical protein n=1 Tax=Mycobacterium sp. B14F4 TaxID=3153565 RepID=UPI00325D6CBF